MSVKRVLVIGDIIADVYEHCTLRKMCPDAPTVPALLRGTIRTVPGGAANVATNLCSLSPDVRINLIGEIDEDVARQVKRMTQNRVEMSYCQMTEEIILTKRRVYQDGKLLLRLDRGDRVGSYTQEMILGNLKGYLAENDPDLILLSDYGHGTVGPDALQLLLNRKDRLLVDTKMTDLSVFNGTLLCKLNQLEWDRVRLTEAAPERFFKSLVVTLGPNGSLLQMRSFLSENVTSTDRIHVPAHSVQTVDVCGCGDTFLAGLASSMLLNDDPYTAMCFASAAAATVVTREGTAVADRDETLRLMGLESETR